MTNRKKQEVYIRCTSCGKEAGPFDDALAARKFCREHICKSPDAVYIAPTFSAIIKEDGQTR